MHFGDRIKLDSFTTDVFSVASHFSFQWFRTAFLCTHILYWNNRSRE